MAGGADYFSTDFIAEASNPFGEAMMSRLYIRLNDGASNAPSTLVDCDDDGHKVIDSGQVTRRREREYGVVQGQAWQVKLLNKDMELCDYDLAGCWACLQAGFEELDEWQTVAQGKISGVTFSTDGTAVIEVHDSVIDLLNYEIPQEYFYDSTGSVSEVYVVAKDKDSLSFDNDVGITVLLANSLTDETYTIEFLSATTYKVILSNGTESATQSISSDYTYGSPGRLTIPASAWDTSTDAYAEGDTFEFFSSARRYNINRTPIPVIQEIIEDFVGVQVYDVITGAYYSTPFYDADAWDLAEDDTSEIINSTDNTYALSGQWRKGTKAITMIQDALKLVNGSIYPTHTGQIGIWLLRPSGGATVALNGDPDAGPVDVVSASMTDTLDYTHNQVTVEYLSMGGEEASYTAVDDDPSINEVRAATVTSGWRVRGEVAQSAGNIFLSRFKDARRQYLVNTTLAGMLADVALGMSVNEPELGITVETTDVTDITVNLQSNTATIKGHNDPAALANYCRVDIGVVGTDRVW